MGITRLANVTGLDCIGISVYMAIRPNARSLAVSQGKGIDPDHAKASALMESVENWHAEWIELPTRIGSYWEMRASAPTVDVFQLPLRAGACLRPDLPAPWVQGYDLIQQQSTWVPYEFVTMNTLLTHSMTLTFYNGSNGLASGNHLLEATLHGLLEVIERDALAVREQEPAERLQQSKLSLSTIESPACRTLLNRFEQAEVDVAAWDLTSDLGFATYACAIGEPGGRGSWRSLGTFRGYGCHLSPEVAIDRALCEAAQSRLTYISGSRDDNPLAVYANHSHHQRVASEHAACFNDPGTLTFDVRRDASTASFEEDIELVLDAFRTAGLESAIIVDLTRADLGIPVVKVIVPGLGLGLHALRNGTTTRKHTSPRASA